MLNIESPKNRLEVIYRVGARIYKMKTSQETYEWFRRTHRPARPGDDFGVYRLRPLPQPLFTFNPQAILQLLSLDWVIPEFHEDGNVLIDGIFMYLFND